MIVDIFIPCLIDQFYPETGFNMIKVLEKVGCSVNYNAEQTCCGQPAYHSGFWDDCKEVSEKFIRELMNDRYIVSPSAACSGFVKKQYGELFYNSSLHNEYKQIQKNMFELSDFLVNILKIYHIGATLEAKAVILDSCAGLRNYGIKKETRLLLEKVKGLEILELKEAESCCGFGGPFTIRYEPVSTIMAEHKLETIMQSGAELVVSNEYSCMMHLSAYAKKKQLPVRFMHLADVLAQGWN